MIARTPSSMAHEHQQLGSLLRGQRRSQSIPTPATVTAAPCPLPVGAGREWLDEVDVTKEHGRGSMWVNAVKGGGTPLAERGRGSAVDVSVVRIAE